MPIAASITIDRRTSRVPSISAQIAEAKARSGSVSLGNTKMPGSTFAVTTDACKVGSKLAKVDGSTCSECYAVSLERFRSNVHAAWVRNLQVATAAIETDPEQWARDIAFQILEAARKSGELFHRWFDGGDLQSVAMLRAMARVAEMTHPIRHWLPTREAAMVKAYLKAYGPFPANLIVRVSSTMVGDRPIAGHAHTSTVHSHGAPHHGTACEAKRHAIEAGQKGLFCGPCRACWNAKVPNVSYPLH